MATTIRYNYGDSTIRNQPITPELYNLLRAAGEAVGIDEVVINSGGQPTASEGGPRTGGIRHDHGNAADLQLVVGGRTLDFSDPADQAIFSSFVRAARANGATGIGAGADYMGTQTIHVGYGTEAHWGGTGENPPPPPAWLTEAFGNPDPNAIQRSPYPSNTGTAAAPTEEPVASQGFNYLSEGLLTQPVNYDDIYPVTSNPTPLEIRDARVNEEIRNQSLSVGLWEATGMAASQQWLGSWLLGVGGYSSRGDDPNFFLNQESLKTLTDGLPEHYWELFESARSQEHANALREYALEDMRKSESLASLGWGGTALSFAAAFLDPAAIAIGIATGGAGYVAAKGAQLGRLGQRLMSSASAAAGEAIYEGIGMATGDPNSTASDILFGAAFGAGLGFLFSPKVSNPLIREEAEALSRLADEMLQPYVTAGPLGSPTPPGPARTPTVQMGREEMEGLATADSPETAFARGRYDLFAALASSASSLVRHASILVQDAVGKKGTINQISTTEERALFFRRWMADWARSVTPAYKDWAKAQGLNAATRNTPANIQRFFTDAAAYVRNRDPNVTFHPSVAKAGDKFRKLMDDIADDINNPLRREGLIGRALRRTPLAKNPNYVPRMDDVMAINRAIETYGKETVYELVQGAIRRANPDWSDPIIEKLGRAWIDNHRNRFYGTDFDIARAFDMGDRANLLKLLEDSKLAPDEIDAIMRSVTRPGPRDHPSNDARMQQRILMDEGFSLTNDKGTLKLSDLFINDLNHIAVLYFQRMAGNIALARTRIRNPDIPDTPERPDLYEMHERDLEDGAEVFAGYDRVVTPEGLTAIVTKTDEAWNDFVKANPGAQTHWLAFANQQKGVVVFSPRLQHMDARTRAYIIEHEVGHQMVIKKIGANYDIKDELRHVTHDQLRAASKLVRPDSWKSNDPAFQRYLNNEQELWADTFSLWRVDRDRAFEVAPGAAKRFDEIFGWRYLSKVEQEALAIPQRGKVVVDGFINDAEFEKYIRAIHVEAEGKKFDADQMKKLREDVERLRFAYNHIKGRPAPQDQKNYAQWLRLLKDFNFLRIAGQFGFAQLNEFGSMITQVGVKATLAQMPAFRRIRNMHGDSILKSGLADEIEGIWGLASDRMTGWLSGRWVDQLGGGTVDGTNKLVRGATSALDTAKRVMADVSGLRPITALQQQWVARAIVQKFSNIAHNPTLANRNRMKQLGLDDATLDRILDQIKTSFTTEQGILFGRKVRLMNLDKWTDLDARAAFENAVFRYARRTIQENELGNLAKWMSHPIAQMFTQFRSFMLGAYTKNFLHNVEMRDWNTAVYFTGALVSSALTYTVWTQLKALGRDDAAEYREKNLSTSAIARAAFARSGWSSLMPMLFDTGADALGFEPVFDFRTTGQTQDMWFGNPTMGLVGKDLPAAIGGIAQSILGNEEMGQENLRAIARVTPFMNAMPLMQMFNSAISGAPK